MSQNVILQGIVGSTAYGLAREGSDIDRLGVFTVPPRELLGLDWSAKKETVVHKSPDSTRHELGKFVRLLLKGNPTVNELLWLDEYEIADSVFGKPLVKNRSLFLSQKTVRSAYLGYAGDQLRRAEGRADGTFDSDTKNRSLKHARHCIRLLEQARCIFLYGAVEIGVEDPELYFSLDDMEWDKILRTLRAFFKHTEFIFSGPSPLPETIDVRAVSDLLDSLRSDQIWRGESGVPINEALPPTHEEK